MQAQGVEEVVGGLGFEQLAQGRKHILEVEDADLLPLLPPEFAGAERLQAEDELSQNFSPLFATVTLIG